MIFGVSASAGRADRRPWRPAGASPSIRSTERRVQAREEIDARLYHRGGVEIGTGGRRCLHGIGQPKVKRKLCGFCEGSDADEDQDGQVVFVRL